jgi:hypothetical protein
MTGRILVVEFEGAHENLDRLSTCALRAVVQKTLTQHVFARLNEELNGPLSTRVKPVGAITIGDGQVTHDLRAAMAWGRQEKGVDEDSLRSIEFSV